MFGFFKKRFCDGDKKDYDFASVPSEKQAAKSVLSNFARKIQQVISERIDDIEFINKSVILYRGQGYADWPLKGAFWSTRESVANNHARTHENPCILRGVPQSRLRLVKVPGFVDRLIGELPDYEDLDDYGRACAEIEKLSREGFFGQFENLDGVVDTTASFDGEHEKIYLFRSNCLGLLSEL